MRTALIWITGLIAGASFGALVGVAANSDPGTAVGIMGGALAFACGRLWATERKASPTMPVMDLKDGRLQ